MIINTDFSGQDITNDVISLHTPLDYFRKFVSEDMNKIEDAADTVVKATPTHFAASEMSASVSRRTRTA